MQSLLFPLRISESGLLRRGERATSVIALLDIMARTPQGSWAACPTFGLRDLFESSRNRADAARLALHRINATLQTLGITEYHVIDVVRELSPGRDTDTYAITVESVGSKDTFHAHVQSQQ